MSVHDDELSGILNEERAESIDPPPMSQHHPNSPLSDSEDLGSTATEGADTTALSPSLLSGFGDAHDIRKRAELNLASVPKGTATVEIWTPKREHSTRNTSENRSATSLYPGAYSFWDPFRNDMSHWMTGPATNFGYTEAALAPTWQTSSQANNLRASQHSAGVSIENQDDIGSGPEVFPDTAQTSTAETTLCTSFSEELLPRHALPEPPGVGSSDLKDDSIFWATWFREAAEANPAPISTIIAEDEGPDPNQTRGAQHMDESQNSRMKIGEADGGLHRCNANHGDARC